MQLFLPWSFYLSEMTASYCSLFYLSETTSSFTRYIQNRASAMTLRPVRVMSTRPTPQRAHFFCPRRSKHWTDRSLFALHISSRAAVGIRRAVARPARPGSLDTPGRTFF
jgi:hypothetical protein